MPLYDPHKKNAFRWTAVPFILAPIIIIILFAQVKSGDAPPPSETTKLETE